MASDLYPGFSSRSPIKGRLKRLEVGAQRIQGNILRPHTVNNLGGTGLYTRLPVKALRSRSPSQGIDLTSTGIIIAGSIPPTGNISGFAYTSTGSSITWYWDGTNSSHVIVIMRADGSRFTVPTAGSGMTVSGLSASTTYYFLPFWNAGNLCNISWVEGTTGSPKIAFVVADTTDAVNTQSYLIQQSLQGNEPLSSGFLTGATQAGGGHGGGGGGGGGAPGRCVMAGTEIQTIGDLPYSIAVHGEHSWVRLGSDGGRELFCTLDHPIITPDRGRVDADLLTEGDTVITETGEQQLVVAQRVERKCSKWEVRMPKGHLFLANGFLSHNVKNQFQ